MDDRGVWVAHPMTQHSYETAAAADGAGRLDAFYTAVYDTGRGLTDRRLQRLLPARTRRVVEQALRRRRHPSLDPARVRTISRWYALGAPAGRLTWAEHRFDRTLARRLARTPSPPRVLHGFEGSCLATLAAARDRSAATVLDVTSAHEHGIAMAEREAAALGLRARTEHARAMTARLRAERQRADRLLAPSPFVRDFLVEQGADPARVVLLPYGVDPERFAGVPAGEREHRGDGPLRVLYAGAITLLKGVRYLLEAAEHLGRDRVDVVLLGRTTDEGEAVRARHPGTARAVGAVPRHAVQEWLRWADVFVFPSLGDSFGLVVLEAMAAALPVIATPTSAGIVRDGVDGYVVAPGDAEAIAQRLAELAADPAARAAMGARGRQAVLDAYTWGHYGERLTAVYEAL